MLEIRNLYQVHSSYFRHYMMYKYVFTKKMKMEFRLEDPLVQQGDGLTKSTTDSEAEESYLVYFPH